MAVLRALSPLIPVAALVFGGCSDGLVDADYRGEPLFRFRGHLVTTRIQELPPLPVRLAMFWSPAGHLETAATDLVEQGSLSAAGQFPGTFVINVFAPPPPEMVGARGYAAGRVLVYQDRDQNGRLNPGTPEVLGGATTHGIVYAPAALPADRSPTGRSLSAGFHIVTWAHLCPATAGRGGCTPVRTRACNARLGAACASDGDCGPDGLCDTAAPGGYCLGTDACFAGAQAGELVGQPCRADTDCRAAEGYRCVACTCDQPEERQRSRAPCDVRYGSGCAVDADCGPDGRCLLRVGQLELPGGYCLGREPSSCRQAGGIFVVEAAPGADLTPVDASGYYKACESDAECRVSEGYACDDVVGACLVRTPLELAIDQAYRVEDFCAVDAVGGDR